MLSQLSEENKKKPDIKNAVGNLKRVARESSANIRKERSGATPQLTSPATTPEKSKSVKDYSIMSPDRSSNGIDAETEGVEGKKFKSRYIDNDGAWTRESVDDGYVEFKDYIKDRRDGVDFGVSFNDKEFKPSRANYEDVSYAEREYKPITYDYSEDTTDVSPELEPYTIGESLGETAGVREAMWNGANKALKFGGKVTEYAVKSVLKYAKQSPYYGTVVNGARNFWSWGAENILRKGYNCPSSAWLLEHALKDKPYDIYRGNTSRIAWLINTNEEYLSALDEAISNSDGKTIYKTLEVQFESGTQEEDDLYFSIHKATITVDGYKKDDGKWLVHATMHEQYDYTELMWSDIHNWDNMSLTKAIGMSANDVATVSSWGDVIKPYWIDIDFYTTR